MLKSLFGELAPLRERSQHDDTDNEFASTAIMDALGDDDDERSAVLQDRHLRDLFVTGSPAQAMRAHFASTRDDMGADQRLITLYDPARMWAAAVIKALSDASGQPIERLNLRDQGSLEALATIERTTLPRRMDNTLKIYHADVHIEGADVALIPIALMEHSDLAAVIVGPMSPSAIDEMLATLCAATLSDNWHCRELLFMLPVGAMWIAHKIDALNWPAKVQVVMLSEPLTSASAVWNKLLAHWNRIKPGQDGTLAAAGPLSGFSPSGTLPWQDSRPVTLPGAALTPPAPGTTVLLPAALAAAPATAAIGHAESLPRVPDPQRALVILRELMLLDGLIFASLVDATNGQIVASDVQGPDIDRAAAAATDILQVHRRTLRQMGHSRPNDPVDEILVTAGNRYHILRTLQAHPNYFILAVLDKLRSNLAMTRFRVMEAQQVLA